MDIKEALDLLNNGDEVSSSASLKDVLNGKKYEYTTVDTGVINEKICFAVAKEVEFTDKEIDSLTEYINNELSIYDAIMLLGAIVCFETVNSVSNQTGEKILKQDANKYEAKVCKWIIHSLRHTEEELIKDIEDYLKKAKKSVVELERKYDFLKVKKYYKPNSKRNPYKYIIESV